MDDHSFVSRRICESTRKCWTLISKEALAGGDRSAERFGITRMLTPAAFFYVQDVRYAAGAGMRGSGVSQICTVLRDVRYAAGAGMRGCGLSLICTTPSMRSFPHIK